MEFLLIGLIAFFRPLASLDYAEGLFDLAAIVLFALAIAAFLMNSALRQQVSVTATDLAILGFVVWCLAAYVVYFDRANIRDVAKLLMPIVMFTVVKNIVQTPEQYRRMLLWMIAGFGIATVLSSIRIVTGSGVDYVNFWTDLPRWRGAYSNAHNLGHSMTLFIMLMVLYLRVNRSPVTRRRAVQERVIFACLGAFAIYCLYMSQVRSAIIGLVVFGLVYGLARSRKVLFMAGAAALVLGAVLFPYWAPALLPDVLTGHQTGKDWSKFGSGRTDYWRHNVQLFSNLPLDQKIAGVGIGNRVTPNLAKSEDILDSHNDWLEMLMQTGVVGLALFALIQLMILRAILRIEPQVRFFYLAMFAAVSVMMFISNSYAWRIQVAYPYYMLIAYVELRRQEHVSATAHAASVFVRSA